ncbi:uncharacterized protein LOC123714219 [Pieris brassicae]|uniref:Farnesoic acid O-methyl transferase domain-containing protein n=1 Tax=Pieris brassicae TaxID=7116 RepID=A0A9P0SZ91_PIEBR|nr:uncharacterized protein LOC123714219 [Pieris brassicae]CAH3984028.1 unnamed protein product [Pieris brassicae]
MSGYPYGNPQFPQQPNAIYPQIYNPSSAPPPGPQGQPMMPGYPYQPGFAVYPGQGVGQQGLPPSAMSYPNVAPTAPAFGYPGFPNVTPQQPWSVVEWIPATPQTAHSLSNKVVVAGYEGHDHSPLWVIRARIQGDLVPGKLAIKHGAAYVPWNGQENPVQNFEVCCAPADKVRWIECRDGIVPPNAIASGNTAAGEPLYVGRAREQGSLTPGKVHPSHKVLYISFGGKEIGHKVYEILCTV